MMSRILLLTALVLSTSFAQSEDLTIEPSHAFDVVERIASQMVYPVKHKYTVTDVQSSLGINNPGEFGDYFTVVTLSLTEGGTVYCRPFIRILKAAGQRIPVSNQYLNHRLLESGIENGQDFIIYSQTEPRNTNCSTQR